MAHAYPSHLFSGDWFELHPKLKAKLGRYGLPLGMGALISSAALFIVQFDSELNMPRMGAEVANIAVGEPSVLTLTSGNYLPEQLFEQEKQANIEELPSQF